MSKKLVISKLFLYRYRFIIGFALLGLAFAGLLFGLPLLSPGGLSNAEMQSAVTSAHLSSTSILNGEVVDLPYHALQKLSITLFGLTTYAIKLPSIIIGLLLGALLILLLNRWFKTNVALFASILAVLSASFLYLAGSGTPLIMLVFWPTLLLWLGSKIQGVVKPKPLYCFLFAFALLGAIFTPHLIYLAAFIVIFALLHPHLRFTIKTLPVAPLVITTIIILLGLAALVTAAVINPAIITELLWAPDFSLSRFWHNLSTAFLPFFSWNTAIESVFLAPLVGLGSVALAIVGLLSTAKGFFASRNSIASCLIVFTIFLAGLNPESAILLLLPLAILIAHGLRYILDKWYDLFPDNPYARISAIFPIAIFLSVMIISDLNHYAFGYRYVPMVADQFTSDLTLARQHLTPGTTLYVVNNPDALAFYQILGSELDLTVSDTLPAADQLPEHFATLGHQLDDPAHLSQIITSPKSDNSDRIYLYTLTQPSEGETE